MTTEIKTIKIGDLLPAHADDRKRTRLIGHAVFQVIMEDANFKAGNLRATFPRAIAGEPSAFDARTNRDSHQWWTDWNKWLAALPPMLRVYLLKQEIIEP